MRKDDRIFDRKKSDKHGIYVSRSGERKSRRDRIRRQQNAEKNRLESFIDRHQTKHKVKRYFTLYVLLPILLVFLYECLGYRSFTGGFEFLIKHPWAYLCNVMIISTSFSLALLFRKRLGIIMSLCLIWTFCAFGNFVLLCNRVTPLTGNDLALVTDLFGIVAKYLTPVETVLVGAAIILAIIFIISCFIKAPLECKKVNYVKSVLTICGMILLTWGCFNVSWHVGGVETQFHELSQSYKKNGFIYCFVNSLVDVGVSKPDGYSPEAIETLVDSSETDPSVSEETADAEKPEKEERRPNVVIVQLESFFDVNRLKDVTFSENPIPNFTKLMESCGSGHFNVPVIGAGTVNTEFEVLTGMNIDDFGAGEYPYKTILKKTTCETLAYDLAGNGYSSHAIHNHVGGFYGRNNIYSNMGFNTFTSLEYMWPQSFTPMNWAKDIVLTGEIQRALNSTEGSDFVYAVSVQGHGSYPSDPATDYERHVTVSSTVIEDEEYLNQISYYVNQLYEMDQFVGALVEMLKNCGEDTVLVMYGDHLPSLDLTDETLTSGSVYQTEYFIWNNMDLSFEDQDMEAYELGSAVLEAIGIKDGVINAYHQNYGKQLQEGSITEEAYLEGLKELEYDILYGDQLCYNGVNPYEATELQMGIEPIAVSSVEPTANGGIRIEGENFTRYSKVYINDKAYTTWYSSSSALELQDVELEPGDVVVVWQKSLSSTEPYIYRQDLVEAETESESETESIRSGSGGE